MTVTDSKKTATVTGIDVAGYLVEDPAKAIAFYRDVLGITPTAVDPEGRGAEFTLSDGFTFGVWREPGAAAGPFFMIAVDDLSAAVAQYRKNGLTVSDPDETPACYMAFTQDNEGNPLIIHQRKAQAEGTMDAPGAAGTIKGVDICGYKVADPDKTTAFYRDVLGMMPTLVDDGRGAEFELADGTTYGIWHVPGAQLGGGFLFAVDDIAAAVTHYRAKGLEVSDVNEGPVCSMAFTQDPEGNQIIIHQRKA